MPAARHPRAGLGALAATGVLALAACGGGDDDGGTNAERFDGEEKAVATVVDRLSEYSRGEEGARICNELLTPALRSSISVDSRRPCADEIIANVGGPDTDFRLEDVAIEGVTARGRVVDQRDRRSRLTFLRAGAAWRIARIAPA